MRLTIVTVASTPPGTYTFTLEAARGADCQGNGPGPTTSVTLVVNPLFHVVLYILAVPLLVKGGKVVLLEDFSADDALRLCRDELPCPPLARMVRLGP